MTLSDEQKDRYAVVLMESRFKGMGKVMWNDLRDGVLNPNVITEKEIHTQSSAVATAARADLIAETDAQIKRASAIIAHALALKTLTNMGVEPTETLATLFGMAEEYRADFGLVVQDDDEAADQ